MKICQIIDCLNAGGAEKVVLDLCKMLVEKNNVSLVLFKKGGEFEEYLSNKAKIKYLNRNNKYSLYKMYELAVFIRSFDIIHIHMRHVYRYVKICDILFNFSKSKLLFHDHYGDIDFDKQVPFLFKNILKPKFYVGVSTVLNNWAHEFLEIKKDNIFLLQNTITNDENIMKKNISINKNTRLVLVSNIRKTKNIEFAIELIKFLDDTFHLTIIGKIIDENYYNDLNKMIDKNDVSHKITWEHNCNNTLDYIKNFDFGIHTAKSETGPLVLMEFLCVGIPFLSFHTGQVVEQLDKYNLGFSISNWNLNLWANKIYSIKDKKYTVPYLISIFEKEFSPKKYIENCIKIYKCLKNY